ncbi:MAG: TVP38/TMEM64 family protein [Candidatus Omnitrophica bacterium]|nr:TVP38/TMEM64 family protein [Candidatus Omnitrophota bacterium]
MSKALWWTIGLTIIAVSVVFSLAQGHDLSSAGIVHRLEPLHAWVRSFGMWMPVMYVVLFVLRPFVLLPSALAMILGGLLFGFVGGTVLALFGLMLSGVAEFAFVRYFAGAKMKDLVRKKAPGIVETVEKRGFLTIFLVRFIPNVPFDLQNCALALTPVKFSDYVWGTLAGCAPTVLGYVFLGHQALIFLKSVQ